jgi:hypothetical protein
MNTKIKKIKKIIPIARTMDRAQKKPALTAGGSSDAEIATPSKNKNFM